jgi:VWFA-related protein
MHRSIARSAIGLCVAAVCAAQEAPPTFQTSTEVVLLDMVVRDKRGQPVLDLRQDEIQVSEDGTRCEVVSVRLVQAGTVKAASNGLTGPAPTAATPPPVSTATPARSSLVVLVFDQLSLEPARHAREAASEFAARSFPTDTWFAVAKIGRGIRLLQTFTSNPADLTSAIDSATIGVDARDAPLSPGFDSVTEQALGAGPVNGSSIGPYRMSELDQMKQGFAKQFDLAQRTQQGHASIAPLRAIVKGLEPVQGRKTLVYFSEGLQLPPDVQAVYETLVSDANRANVTVYSLDTRGLTIKSPTESSRLRLQPSSQVPGDGDPMAAVKPALGRDDQEDALRGLNVQANMESLALATGGFLIGNSNDLRSGLDRVAGELASYYEVAYVPPNAERDGKFCRIQAKVLRPGVTLRTRSGYFRSPSAAPDVPARDLPLMSALEAATPPRDFEQHAQVLHFGADGGERDAVLLLEVPLAQVQLSRDEAQKTYRAHLSLVALIKDEAGRLVTRLSHDWPLEGPLDQAEGAAKGTVTFRRSLRLAPGRYHLEAAVQDRENGALSVERFGFTIPAGGPGVALSSLIMLKQGDRRPPTRARPIRCGSPRSPCAPTWTRP